MKISIKSRKIVVPHLEFVWAIIPFVTSIIEEKGHAHLVVETEHDLVDISKKLSSGYGPLEFVILSQN